MASPATPSNFYVQQGNRNVYLSWDIAVGALSYQVQRSTDGVTYSNYASVVVNNYLDTAATVGTLYYYQVQAVNASGSSPFANPQSVVPTPSGEMSLGQIRLLAQQRADRVNSNFLKLPEWNSNINQSLFELYDLLITTYEDYFLAPVVEFVADGTTSSYPLPDGLLYSGAPAFYKLSGVDLGISNANNAFVTLNKFNFADRNRYVYPNSASTIYGVFNLQYRLMGSNILFIPTPSASQILRLWYIPRLTQLLQDTDTTSSGISGWIEYVIIDAAIKALQKEESDVSVLMAQKMALIKRIQDSASNKDAGRPDTVSNVRNGDWGGNGGFGQNGAIGGF